MIPALPAPSPMEVPSDLEAEDALKYHPSISAGKLHWPREVGLGFKVENILWVDAASARFSATVKVSYEWQLTAEEHASFEHWKKEGWQSQKIWRPAWEPQVGFPNVEKIELQAELPVPNSDRHGFFDVFHHNGKVYTVVYMRFRCVYSETYELQNFPFDCQDLTFLVESTDASKIKLRSRFKRDDFASIDLENFTLAEWELHPPIASFESGLSSKGRSGSLTSSRFYFLVKLRRRHQFYVGRIMFLAGMLTFGSLLSWSIDVQMPHRLLLCFTILLTLVAFQMAIGGKLPQIRYFTLLDMYLIASQRFMLAVAVEHAILKKFVEDPLAIDDLLLGLTASAYIGLQLIFFSVVRLRSKKENEKLMLNAAELQEWLVRNRQQGGTHEKDLPDSFKLKSSECTEEQVGKTHCITYHSDVTVVKRKNSGLKAGGYQSQVDPKATYPSLAS